MKHIIETKAKAGDKVLAINRKRNGKQEYFTIKHVEAFFFDWGHSIRYKALTCRETKKGKIKRILIDSDILEVCL